MHLDNGLCVRRERIGDVFQGNKGRGVHQVIAKQHRRAAWAAQNLDRLFRISGARVHALRDSFYGLDYAILALKHLASSTAPLETLADQLRGIDAVQHVVEIIGVAPHHGAGEGDDLLRDARQDSKSVTLSSIASQLVHLVGDRKVEEIEHVPPHVIQGSHALNP